MAKKSAGGRTVHRGPAAPAISPEEMAALVAAMDQPIETSGTPVGVRKLKPVVRDPKDRLPKPSHKSVVQQKILLALDRRNMTRYQLWRKAKRYCPTLSESAVYEYLRGTRNINIEYAEAMMKAAKVTVHAPLAIRRPAGAKRAKPASSATSRPFAKKDR